MHALIFCESFWPTERGGAGRVAADVCQELLRRGHVLDVVSPAPVLNIETVELGANFRLHRMPAGDGPLAKQIDFAYSPRMTGESFEYMRANINLDAVDVFHDNGGFFQVLFPLELMLLDALPRARSIVQYQIQYRPLFATEATIAPHAQTLIERQRLLAQRVGKVAFLSGDEREEGVATFALGAERDIRIVPNAIPLERYAGLESFVPLWDMQAPPRIALAGRLGSPMKGLGVALKSLAELAPKAAFEVLLVGHQPQPGEIPPPLQGRVRATGWLEARGVAEALHGCAAFLMPSRYEPFGLLALEAQAVMCPVVATATGGLKDIILDGETGLLCAPDRVEADIQRHVLALLRDNDLREDLAHVARARLEAHYTIPVVCDQLEALYRG